MSQSFGVRINKVVTITITVLTDQWSSFSCWFYLKNDLPAAGGTTWFCDPWRRGVASIKKKIFIASTILINPDKPLFLRASSGLDVVELDSWFNGSGFESRLIENTCKWGQSLPGSISAPNSGSLKQNENRGSQKGQVDKKIVYLEAFVTIAIWNEMQGMFCSSKSLPRLTIVTFG